MNKIIIHIGPPKTATTSLQYYYKNKDLSLLKTKFIGIVQPRYENNKNGNNSIVNDIYKFLKNPNNIDENKIYATLDKLFQEFDFIIISEEMFLCKENWPDKLNNLFTLIKDYDHEIIVCLRDIRKALPSYYGELYNNISKFHRDSYKLFEKSKHSQIYDYEKIADKLKIFKKVNYIEFDKLVNNRITEKKLLPGISKSDEYIYMSNQNSKKRNYYFDKVEVIVNVDKYKPTLFYKILFHLLSILKLHKLKPLIRKRLVYDKMIEVEISDHIKDIHKRNLKFIEKLNA